MSDEPNQPEEPKNEENSAPQAGTAWRWFLLGIAPIPIGLLAGSSQLFDSFQRGNRVPFVSFLILTLAFTLSAGIGQSGGFKTKHFKKIAIGIFCGIWIAGFDMFAVYFIGCCSAISQIH